MFDQILHDLQSHKILGAETLALEAVRAWEWKRGQTDDPQALRDAAEQLKNTRPTQGLLRNALLQCLMQPAAPQLETHLRDFLKTSRKKIAHHGSELVPDQGVVFTHCYSTAVLECLVAAWNNGKRFTVHNTETRPDQQGRKMAAALAAHGIPVEHFTDAAGSFALQNANLFLLGCESVLTTGEIVNKVGTRLLMGEAERQHIPIYLCSHSWKWNPDLHISSNDELEPRDPSAVWAEPPAGIHVHNPTYELASSRALKKIVSEEGIFEPNEWIAHIEKQYPWIKNGTPSS